MIHSMRERYEELKQYKNIMLNYDDILLYCPDYYKIKSQLEKEHFPYKEEVDKVFNENYTKSSFYKKLIKKDLSQEEIYEYMCHNKDIKYDYLKSIHDKLVKSSISLCDLIDYIGHYPTTWPVPKEEEKNPEMEELLEKYDIIVRYYMFDDIDEMQIMSDDVVRIIDRLETNLDLIKQIKEAISTNDWMFRKIRKSEKTYKKDSEEVLAMIDSFPLSAYQEKNESRREEGKKYLRKQHGNNII